MEKLNLILDLDHTLLQTKCVPSNRLIKGIEYDNTFTIETGTGPYGTKTEGVLQVYVKLRPGLKEFLNFATNSFNCFIFTNSHRTYAEGLIRIIDPDGTMFKGRTISRSPDPIRAHLEALLLHEGLSIPELLKCEESGVITRLLSGDFDVFKEISDPNTLRILEKTDFDFLHKSHDPLQCELCKMKIIYPCLGDPKHTILVDNDNIVWKKGENLVVVEPFYPYTDDNRIPYSMTTAVCHEMLKSELSYALDNYNDRDTLDRLGRKLLEIKREFERREGKVDIPTIMDEMKRRTFGGKTLFIPQERLSSLGEACAAHGAKMAAEFIPGEVTHVITLSLSDLEKYKSMEEEKMGGEEGEKTRACFVTPLWLIESIKNWNSVDTEPYLTVKLEERLIRETKKLENTIEELRLLETDLEKAVTKAKKRKNQNDHEFQPEQKVLCQ